MIDSPLLTVAEAADYLRISRSHLYRLLGAGELTYVSLATRKRMLERSELDLFITRRKVS
jgi:excisionase family DNA binding protein